ncbi:MAG: nitroreductase family protein [Bacteroidales bacterium]|nr:nitroreductase family protein [Bacteroidales bacterium]
MNKDANSRYNLTPLLKQRWSPRAFSNQMVEKEKIQALFEAARWTPSSSNQQPWRFIIGFKGDPTYEKIMDSLVEFNQLWAQTAPVLIVSIGKLTNNKGEHNNSSCYDVGQAVAHMTVQATSMGLYVHQMGGFSADSILQSFEIPEQHMVQTLFTVGYIGDPEVLHPNLKKMEYAQRDRIDFDEFVFSGTFGQKSDLFDQ